MNSKTRTIIEFDPSFIKVIQGSSLGLEYQKAVIKIQDLTDDQIILQLVNLRKDKRFNFNQSKIIASLSRQLVLIRYLDLPSENAKQITSMVDLLSASTTPYSRDEMVVDFMPLDKNQEGFTKVCVVIVEKQVVERVSRLFHQAVFEIDQITFSSIGLWYWYKDIKSVDFNTTLLVDEDSSRTEFCIFNHKYLVSSRSTQTRDINDVLTQTKLTIDAYAKESLAKPISEIIISSKRIDPHKIKDQMTINYKANIDFLPVHDRDFEEDLSFRAAIGLLKTSENILIDLRLPLSKSVSILNLNKGQKIRLIVLAFLTVLSVVIFFNVNLFNDILILRKLEKEYQQIQPELQKSQEKLTQLKIIKDKFEHRLFFVDLIDEINQFLPKTAVVAEILFDGKQVSFLGYASQEIDKDVLKAMIINSEYFEKPVLEYFNPNKVDQMEKFDFKLSYKVTK